jgi:hypothetical protein
VLPVPVKPAPNESAIQGHSGRNVSFADVERNAVPWRVTDDDFETFHRTDVNDYGGLTADALD